MNTPIAVEYMAWIGSQIEHAPVYLRIKSWWSQFQFMRGIIDWEKEVKYLSKHLKNIWTIYEILVKSVVIDMKDSKCSPKMMIDFINEFVKEVD